jgi:bifunctional DNA-binding transcriptional regulator/antitoxin component of YhaV-PrlF toxin-antitoxin module
VRIGTIIGSGRLWIPAEIRKRWGTRRVVLDDQGDQLFVKPLPDDPIAAARGAFEGRIGSTSELRRAARRDEMTDSSRL